MNYQTGQSKQSKKTRMEEKDFNQYIDKNATYEQYNKNKFAQSSYNSPQKNHQIDQYSDFQQNSKKQKEKESQYSDKKQTNGIKSLDQLLIDQSINKLKNQQSNYKNAISTIQSEYGNYKVITENEILTSKIQIQQLNQQIQNQSESHESIVIQLNAQIESLTQEIEYYKKKYEEIHQQKQKFFQLIEDLQKKNNIQEEENKKKDIACYQQKSNFEIKVQKLEAKLNTSNQKIIQIESDKRELASKFLNINRGQQDDASKELENQLQKIDIENSLLRNEIFDLKLNIKEKNRKIESLEFKTNQERSHQESFLKQMESLNNKILAYQKECIQKDQQILNLMNQNEKVQNVQQCHSRQIENLNQQIISKENEINILKQALDVNSQQQHTLNNDFQETEIEQLQFIKNNQHFFEKTLTEFKQKNYFCQDQQNESEQISKDENLCQKINIDRYTNSINNQYNFHLSSPKSPKKSNLKESSDKKTLIIKQNQIKSNQINQNSPNQIDSLQNLYVNTHSRSLSSSTNNIYKINNHKKFDTNEIMKDILISRKSISSLNYQYVQNIDIKSDIQEKTKKITFSIENNPILQQNQETQVKEQTQDIQQTQVNEQTSINNQKSCEVNIIVQEIKEDQEYIQYMSTQNEQEFQKQQPNNLQEIQINQHTNPQSKNQDENQLQQKQQLKILINNNQNIQNDLSIPKPLHKSSLSFSTEDQDKIQLIKLKRKSQIDDLNEIQLSFRDISEPNDQNNNSAILDNLINKNDKLFKKIQDNITKVASMNNLFSDSQSLIGSQQNLHQSMNNSFNLNLNKMSSFKEPKVSRSRFISNQEEQEDFSFLGSEFCVNLNSNSQNNEGQSDDLEFQKLNSGGQEKDKIKQNNSKIIEDNIQNQDNTQEDQKWHILNDSQNKNI